MNSVVLRKNGGFYLCFDNDAIIISYLFGYKIVNGRVGFPINSLNKITNLLENDCINYSIKENLEEVNKKSFGKKNKYKFYLEKGKNKIYLDKRVNAIMDKINNLEYDKLNNLLDIIEENIWIMILLLLRILSYLFIL